MIYFISNATKCSFLLYNLINLLLDIFMNIYLIIWPLLMGTSTAFGKIFSVNLVNTQTMKKSSKWVKYMKMYLKVPFLALLEILKMLSTNLLICLFLHSRFPACDSFVCSYYFKHLYRRYKEAIFSFVAINVW
jgi:hypothetical protein